MARGGATELEGAAEAVAVLVAASTTTEAISMVIKSSGLHSPPRNISSSSRRSISGSHRSINSSSSSGRQDTLAGGDNRVFVSVATSRDTSMQSVERYLPRR